LPIYYQSALDYDIVVASLSLLAYTLPTLVIPPFAERLSHRYQPAVIVPLGMFTIGLGFILMRLGAGFTHASGLTMLPGSLVAGVGLGLTNTPTTNTTTGSVPSNRAGMASGMDISARLITLAINIAFMGLVLVAGIADYLRVVLPASFDAAQLQALAERIAAGNLPGLAHSFPGFDHVDASGAIAHAALVHGFRWVMLYGGLGVWVLGALSAMIFRARGAR
jgi:hypothetical protein